MIFFVFPPQANNIQPYHFVHLSHSFFSFSSPIYFYSLDACYGISFGNQEAAVVAMALERAEVDRKSFAYYAVTKLAGVRDIFQFIAVFFLFKYLLLPYSNGGSCI